MVAEVEFTPFIAEAVEKRDIDILIQTTEILNRVLSHASDNDDTKNYNIAKKELRQVERALDMIGQ